MWLGDIADIASPQDIVAAGILAVVDIALNEKPAVLPRDLIYCRFPLIDGTGNPAWLLRLAVETVASLLRLRYAHARLLQCGPESLTEHRGGGDRTRARVPV